jgi:hypothetical protein
VRKVVSRGASGGVAGPRLAPDGKASFDPSKPLANVKRERFCWAIVQGHRLGPAYDIAGFTGKSPRQPTSACGAPSEKVAARPAAIFIAVAASVAIIARTMLAQVWHWALALAFVPATVGGGAVTVRLRLPAMGLCRETHRAAELLAEVGPGASPSAGPVAPRVLDYGGQRYRDAASRREARRTQDRIAASRNIPRQSHDVPARHCKSHDIQGTMRVAG